MEEGGLQVVFAISCRNNLPDVSVPPFNVTDCRIWLSFTFSSIPVTKSFVVLFRLCLTPIKSSGSLDYSSTSCCDFCKVDAGILFILGIAAVYS